MSFSNTKPVEVTSSFDPNTKPVEVTSSYDPNKNPVDLKSSYDPQRKSCWRCLAIDTETNLGLEMLLERVNNKNF